MSVTKELIHQRRLKRTSPSKYVEHKWITRFLRYRDWMINNGYWTERTPEQQLVATHQRRLRRAFGTKTAPGPYFTDPKIRAQIDTQLREEARRAKTPAATPNSQTQPTQS